MYKPILVAALLASPNMMPASAHGPAGSADNRATQVVRYDDLDLSRRGDRARLDRRVAAAIETLCGSYATSFSFEEEEIARCRAAARANADVQLARLPRHGGAAGAVATLAVGTGGRE
jgi:UrcA family protein